MEKHVDRSLGGFRYAMSIIRGKSCQVSHVVEHTDGKEIPVEGDFILTIGKSAVILTRNREPIIVKHWNSRSIEGYITESNMAMFFISGVKLAEVYQDADGWIWEGIVDGGENYFNVIQDGNYLYTITFG